MEENYIVKYYIQRQNIKRMTTPIKVKLKSRFIIRSIFLGIIMFNALIKK